MRLCFKEQSGFSLLPILLTLLLSLYYQYVDAGLSKEKMLFTALRDSDCQVNCTSAKKRALCGTDGVPYNSRCAVERSQCKNWTVSVGPNRPCPNIREQFQDNPAQSLPVLTRVSVSGWSKCHLERQEAQARARKPAAGVFIPQCEADGSFSQVQCHAGLGFCWCFTPSGKHIQGTTVHGRQPNCKGKVKRQRNRRRRKGKRGCTKTDREIFNSNLISEFAAEYYRETPKPTEPSTSVTGKSQTSLNAAQKRIVDWKFTQLDKDKDNILKSREVRSLKRLVKKLVKPRRCAKSFIEYCDTDQDKKIISKEWSLCLGLNLSRSNVPQMNFSESGTKRKTSVSTLTNVHFPGHNPGLDGIEEQTTQPPRGHIVSEGGGLIPSHIWNRPSSNTRRGNTESTEPDTTDELASLLGKIRLSPSPPETTQKKSNLDHRSCLEERAAAIKINQEDPNGQTFSPECTPMGKYKKTQCYNAICWCVDEDTGKSIHATTSFNKTVNCDMKPDREMKGCPRPQKRRFLVDLMSELKAELRAERNATETIDSVPTEDLSGDLEPSIVVKWKMNSLDANKNGFLERKELTKFKRDLRKRKKKSRKCGRNFLRYCDEDRNKKITLEEFIDCMGVNHNYHSMTLHSPRRGQNPLSKYLISE